MAEPVVCTAEQSPGDFYDVMVTGHTGQGKSTTVDKLLIANPDNIIYEYTESSSQIEAKDNRLECGDLSIWVAIPEQLERIGSRFQGLIAARKQQKPQDKINTHREQQGTREARTQYCELLSNNTTRIRLLDVPGFYDESLASADTQAEGFKSELAVMRNIIKIQRNFDLQFEKVLYFLPVRGPLERADAVVQNEMKILMYFFGKSVMKKLVLVATNQKRLSAGVDGDYFCEEDRRETISNFKRCLVLKRLYKKEDDIPQVPLICVSLSETCESILEKVKGVVVSGPKMHLQFNVCESCGKKVGFSGEHKMVCYLGESESQMEAYENSYCHPRFVYNYKWFQKVTEVLARIVTIGRVDSLAKFFNLKEMCVKCNGEPGSEPCCKIGESYVHSGETIICDHKLAPS